MYITINVFTLQQRTRSFYLDIFLVKKYTDLKCLFLEFFFRILRSHYQTTASWLLEIGASLIVLVDVIN